MSDRYDDMGTADLLREVCRKLDRIEAHSAPVHVRHAKVVTDRTKLDRAVQRHLISR